MKICWDNLEELRYNREKSCWYNRYGIKVFYAEACKTCGEPFLYDCHSGGLYCCKKCNNSSIGRLHKGKNNPNYKGGYAANNISLYDTYAYQINYAEEVRRDPNDKNILQVKCAYCGRWCTPKMSSVVNRINALNGKVRGEYRLYCSELCKQNCPIFEQKKYPKGFKPVTSREVQPELRQMVFKRDDWTCQKCWAIENLHCHHITGIMLNPIESADMDNCITLCKECHKFVHTLPDCGYHQLRCKNNE